MFTKILIANRGEIACRVAATARRMGVRTVAVYSRADAQAQHVRACDEAVYIGLEDSESGGSAARDSYLRGDAVIAAALQTGAQAIHPGYGFLSENEGFAAACAVAGLVFIGPPPSAIEAMGLKAESKRLMHAAGVPLVPGYHGESQDAALLAAEAEKMGYPVLIKASAGGGGRGMRRVERAADFADALASCQREAQASFGNAAVLVEKYVQRPRHIEIQVFADTQGNAVHLFERDCSVQRRHQKVLEEAPAPNMPPALRERMGAAAVAAAQAVGYVGAGTVEFIVSQTAYDQPEAMQFYFMEMNTRLQVEHPVTEAVTGLDLVEWQLRVAAGEPLPLAQDQIRLHGHAIEARICAENPSEGFLPAVGRLAVFVPPVASAFAPLAAHPSGVRFDSGFTQGDTVSPHYDSMLAKLIVHGADRAEALRKLDAALAQLHIAGIHTNVDFLRRVAASPSFSQAQLDTALIEREQDALFAPLPVDAQAVAQACAAFEREAKTSALSRQASSWQDPWSAANGWRMVGRAAEPSYEVNGTTTAAARNSAAPKGYAVYALSAAPANNVQVYAQAYDQTYAVFTPHGQLTVHKHDPLAYEKTQDAAAGAGSVAAPMPGKVIALHVKAGDAVDAGQVLAVLEAMKMEHSLRAPSAGTVAEVLCAVGEQVGDGAVLVVLEAPSAQGAL